MSAQTGMDHNEKRRALHRLDALHASARDIVQKGTRPSGDVLLMLETLQAFKDGTLGAFVRTPRRELSVEEIVSCCGLEITAVPFSPEDQCYLKARGLRYVGEIYYLWFDPRSRSSLDTEMRIKEVLTGRLGLPEEADPIALGWEPSYWKDPSFLQELNVLILDRCPTPKEPDWDAQWHLPFYRRSHPHLFGLARRMHLTGVHYIGELSSRRYVETKNKHCPPSRRSPGVLLKIGRNLKKCGSHLWAGCLLPPDWEFPDWKVEDIWMAELIKIGMENERFEAAKKRCEAESQRRRKKGL